MGTVAAGALATVFVVGFVWRVWAEFRYGPSRHLPPD